jgi:hypothetical protein
MSESDVCNHMTVMNPLQVSHLQLLKSSGSLMYHLLYYPRALHSAHIVYLCVSCDSYKSDCFLKH